MSGKLAHKVYIQRTAAVMAAASIFLFLNVVQALAQSGGSNSSYSQVGMGLLNDESQGWNRAMGGVGVALPSGNRLNTMNPASYAYIDSLSFILDVGMSGSFGRMSNQTSSKNIRNASFDYIIAGFRLRRHLGLSFGFKPYSSIGYDFTSTDGNVYRDKITGEIVKSSSEHSGSGGLRKAFAGIGWRPFSGLSLGMHVNILWGGYTHILMHGFTISNSNGFNYIENASITTYQLDFGAQYALRLSRKDWLTIGATVALGHKYGGDGMLLRFMDSGDTLTVNIDKDAFDLPMKYSGGLGWQHKNNLLVSADYTYTGWGNCRIPTMIATTEGVTYHSLKGSYRNNSQIRAGVEWTPNPTALHGYLNRVKYRMGLSYATPHLAFADKETGKGPSETTLSIGAGFPINNMINRRIGLFPVINVGMQWLRRAPADKSLVTENYFVINLGVTFNERWFMKYKIQ